MCMLVIALGLSVILILFNLANNLFFRLPQLPDSDRYVVLLGVDESFGFTNADLLDNYTYQFVAERNQSFDVLGRVRFWGDSTLSGGESAAAYSSTSISPNLLQLTGVTPILGRSLLPEDAIPGAEPVAVISHNVWQNYYSGRQDVVGVQSRVDGELRTVVGVMPKDFSFPAFHNLWLPSIESSVNEPGEGRVTPVGRLKHDVSLAQAQTELATLLIQIKQENPSVYGSLNATVQPYISIYESNGAGLRDMIVVICLAVLALACLNVASLLLVRAGERSQELVIRSAIGGARWRIVVQALIEPFLICLGGGALGLALAHLGIKITGEAWALGLSEGSLPFWMKFEIDASTAILAMLIVGLMWLVIGGYRAWRASNIDLGLFLGGNNKGATVKGASRFTSAVVALQVVFSVLLLIVGGTFVLAIRAIETTNFGTATDGYLTARVRLSGDSYIDTENRDRYLENVQIELDSVAGIESSAFTSALPSGRSASLVSYGLEDRDIQENSIYPTQFEVAVSNDYFDLMQVPLIEGRNFSSQDLANSLPVVIVDQSFSDTVWPDESPLGKRILLNANIPDSNEWLTIVGVVPHIIQSQPIAGMREITSVYRPFSQSNFFNINLIAKTTGDPNLHREALITASARVDRELALRDIKSFEQVIANSTFGQSILSTQMTWVSLAVLVLAISGIFGLISRSVMSRTQEIGIRQALGLNHSNTIALFLRQGIIYLILGLIIGGGMGVLGAYGASELMPEGVDSVIPVTLFVAVLMALLIFAASYIPARKLILLEPGEALHYE